MDRITKKLVETVNGILAEAAARGGAAIFAGMSDAQFDDWIKANPGAAEKARALRAQGRGQSPGSAPPPPSWSTTEPGPQSSPPPSSPESRFPNVENFTTVGGFNDSRTEYGAHREIRNTTDREGIEHLMSHRSARIRGLVAQHNKSLTSEDIFRLLNDTNRDVRVATASSANLAIGREHVQHVFNSVMGGSSDDPYHATNKQALMHMMRSKAVFITPEMHSALMSSPHADLRDYTARWSQTHGTGYSNSNNSTGDPSS